MDVWEDTPKLKEQAGLSAQKLQTRWEQEEEPHSELLWSAMGLCQSHITWAGQLALPDGDTHGEMETR